jgi:hypothetical protein
MESDRSEIRFRFVNFFLCLLVIALAAALFVSGPTLISGYAEDTGRHLETLQAEADKLEGRRRSCRPRPPR